MIQASNKFKEILREYGRMISLRISFDDVVLDHDNIRTVSRSYDAEMFRCCMQILNVSLEGRFSIASNSIEIEFGVKRIEDDDFEYINLGEFIIDKETVSYNVESDTTSFTAYDLILKSHIKYNLEDVSYPLTIKEYLELICNHLGLEYEGSDFTNSSKFIDDDKYLPIPESTFRDALDEIAGVAAGIIVIENGKLRVKYPTETNQVIDEDSINSFSVSDKWGPVESVTLAREPQEDNVIYPESSADDLVNVRITNNQIMDKYREEFIENIYSQVHGFEFYPFEISGAFLYFEPYDIITLKDLEGNTYKSIIMSCSTQIDTGISETFETVKPEVANTDYSRSSSIRKTFLNVELYVDKQQGEIAAIVQENQEQEDKISQLIIDIDSIKTSVEKISGFSVIYNLNGDVGHDFWEFKSTGLLPASDLLPSTTLLPWRLNMPTFIIKDYSSLSETGLYFIVPGSAVTQKCGYILGGEKYSFRCKRVDGNGRFKVYIQEWSNHDEEMDKETLILDTQGYPQLYESASITLDSSTTFIKMRIESFDEEFGISELMFNQGEPRGYVKSPDDVYYFARSEINQLADQIQLRVTKDEFNSEINILSNEIGLKVDANGIISAINLSPEVIKILANKIQLEGITTINNNFMVDLNGKIHAIDGEFSGTVKSSNIEGSQISGSSFISNTSGYKALELTGGQIRFFDWYTSTHNYIGKLVSAVQTGTSKTRVSLVNAYSSSIVIGYADDDSESNANHSSYVVFDKKNGARPVRVYEQIQLDKNVYNLANFIIDGKIYFSVGTDKETVPTRIGKGSSTSSLEVGSDNYIAFYPSGASTSIVSMRDYGTEMWGTVKVNGNFSVTGTKNRIVKTENHGSVALSAVESPTCLFEDNGSAILNDNGICYIMFDEVFKECINTKCEYYVQLTKCGKGDLYVKDKHKDFFIVEGTEGLKFDWNVKAKQRDYEADRLKTVNDKEEREYEDNY